MAASAIMTTKDAVIAYANDKSLTVYGKASSMSVYAQEHLLDKLDATKASLLGAIEHVLTTAKHSNSGDTVLALNARICNGVLYIQAEMFKVSNMMNDKLHVAYTCFQASVTSIPKPLTCNNFICILVQQAEAASFRLTSGMAHLLLKSTEKLQSSKAKALEVLASAKPTVEAYLSKVRDGSIVIRSKIEDSVDQIKANGIAARSKASQEYTRVCNALREALEGLPLDSAFIDSATNKVQILKSKIGDLQVYVKDGAVHATGQIEARCVHVKATITEVRGSLRLSFVEAVSSAKTRCQDAAKASMIKADEIKKTSQAAKKAGKHNILMAVEYSKEKARDEEVQAMVAGAVVGASAGGATGFAAGATAGTACGLLFAPFTLGLSIPIGAVIGGSTGTGLGAMAGSTLGAIGVKYASESCMEMKQGILEKVRLVSGTGGMDHESK